LACLYNLREHKRKNEASGFPEEKKIEFLFSHLHFDFIVCVRAHLNALLSASLFTREFLFFISNFKSFSL